MSTFITAFVQKPNATIAGDKDKAESKSTDDKSEKQAELVGTGL